jgi:flagellar motor protein MotB
MLEQPRVEGSDNPKDTNATLEGRARNRRVELAKIR